MKEILLYIKEIGLTGWLYFLLITLSLVLIDVPVFKWSTAGFFTGVFIEKNIQTIADWIKGKFDEKLK